jgi:hypothetical protein
MDLYDNMIPSEESEGSEGSEDSESISSDTLSIPSTLLHSETESNKSETESNGCEHYNRSLYPVAKCCGKIYPCRICHDDNSDHKIDRFATEQMHCVRCELIQPVSSKCVSESCKEFPETLYFCGICKYWDDSINKEIYHCDKCGVCRLGKVSNYFHCDKCNACKPIEFKDSHICITNSMCSDCPICLEYMFYSRDPVGFLKCGHPMHKHCLDHYLKYDYRCLICRKSIGEPAQLFENIDEYMKNCIIPEEHIGKISHISCNDCEKKSDVQYHYTYHKCLHCNSYNTII